MKFLLCIFLLMALSDVMSEDFNFSAKDLNDELGHYNSCKGKDIYYPQEELDNGMAQVPGCITTLMLGQGGQLNKNCVALCVAEKIGLLNEDRTYNEEKAFAPLDKTVVEPSPTTGKTNDKDIIEIQKRVLRKCAGIAEGKKFFQRDDCKEAREFEQCMKEGAAKECGV